MTGRNALKQAARAVAALVLAGSMQVVAGAPALAALATLDFGSVNVGDGTDLQQELPLTYSLSQIPPDTVVYSGGNPTLDASLLLLGLTPPVTAGQLYAIIGEVTATYHLTLTLAVGTDFSVDAAECQTATDSCTATVTFAPTEQGVRSDTLSAHISNLQVTGDNLYLQLLAPLAPFLQQVVEEQLTVDLTGIGSGASSGLQLQVSVAPEAAPCVLLGAASIDFGTLPFSTNGQLSEGTAGIDVSSCSTGSEAVYVNGTDATGDGNQPAQWLLSDAGGNPCATAVDRYGVSLGTDGSATFQLSTTSTSWIVMDAGASVPTSVGYQMPCVGSSGAGQTMSSQVTFLATVP
ncbi:MAG: hypothetical protein WB297_13405 [Actinomycetota bacterium]